MTETQKEIIEILKPYMNKEVKFWCLIKHKDVIYNFLDFSETKKWKRFRLYLNKKLCNFEIKEIEGEIIWRYDIYAILLFFQDKIWEDNIFLNLDSICLHYNYEKRTSGFSDPKFTESYIPFKDPFLYTEEESKNLLLILIYFLKNKAWYKS